MIVIIDDTWYTRLAPILGLRLDIRGPVATPTDQPWRPPSTIDRAVALGMSREQAEHFNITSDLDAIVKIGEQALEAHRRAAMGAPPAHLSYDWLCKAIAAPTVAGNRLARRTAKAERRKARR